MLAACCAASAGANVEIPAFLANAVGGVAAVGDQADLLAHLIHGVGQRRGRGDGQLGAVRLVPRRRTTR